MDMLAKSGLQVNARTVRNWRLRGHITRTKAGYDPVEILAYVERRTDLRGKLNSCLST